MILILVALFSFGAGVATQQPPCEKVTRTVKLSDPSPYQNMTARVRVCKGDK